MKLRINCICSSRKEQANADFYCKTCLKLYCGKCIQLHDKWFKKHSAYGRNDMKEWPVSKLVEEFLLKCEAHKDDKIEMLCDDHSQLCCTKCAFNNHSYFKNNLAHTCLNINNLCHNLNEN